MQPIVRRSMVQSILVIEDSYYVRRLIREILEADGYRVVEAENGTKGMELIGTEIPDCIILDLIMPDVQGMAILEDCLTGLKIPVIVVTAHIQDRLSEYCIELGAASVVSKPFSKDELRYAVTKALSPKAPLFSQN